LLWGYDPAARGALSPNGRVLRHPGDLEWLEGRRLQAAELFAQGKTKAVAGELGVSAQTASRWWQRWRDGGAAGMRAARQGNPTLPQQFHQQTLLRWLHM
jgi:transposase